MDLNDTTNRVIAVIVLLLIFIGGWWLIARNAVNSKAVTGKTDSTMTDSASDASKDVDDSTSGTMQKPSGDTGASMSPSTTTSGDEAVAVADQPAGSAVSVSSASLSQLGWLAVRDADGHVLGAKRLEAGTSSNVPIELLRATKAGEHYQVLIYVDDGDKEFDLHKDTIVTKQDGTVAGTSFAAL